MAVVAVAGALSDEQRVEELLGRMTLAEKVAQLGGVRFSDLVGDGGLDETRMRAALADGIGHVGGVATESGGGPRATAAIANQIQRFLLERTRLGVPAVIHEEAIAGVCASGATQFPQAIGLASAWDPALVEAVAASCRRHLLAVGARMALSPVLDLARDPRWGRLEETYGEDPELASRLAVAYVRGLQGRLLRDGVAATAKHFVAHGAPEGGFNHGEVSVGHRRLRDVFAAPFRAAINEASLAAVMSAYHEVDGLPCSGSPEILTTLLRDDLGFDGVVLSDHWAVTHLQTFHHVAQDGPDAAQQAIEAGVDVELPALDRFRHLTAMVQDGRIDEAVIDRAVRRVLLQKMALGLFERALVDEVAAPRSFDTRADRRLARRAAVRSMVLLTNDGTLPLDPSRLRRVAVVGPAADDRRLLLGDYNYPSQVDGNDYVDIVTPLAGLRGALPEAEIVHARGARLTGEADPALLEEAVGAARAADAVIVFVGGMSGSTPAATSGELRDAAHLELPAGQRRLVAAVAATGTPSVVVVISGRAHALETEAAVANALVLAWLPGEEGGNAIAAVLCGRRSPAGRLPVSLLRSAGQVGVGSGHHKGGGASQPWGPYVDEPNRPLFCFGHGLSFTAFDHRDLQVTAGSTSDEVRVAVTVANTGSRAGDEVVQVYARDEVTSVGQPERRLLAFARVGLRPGEAKRIVFDVPAGRLGFTDRDGRFVVEPGEVTILVSASYDDVRVSATVELTGRPHYPDPNSVPPCRRRLRSVRAEPRVGGADLAHEGQVAAEVPAHGGDDAAGDAKTHGQAVRAPAPGEPGRAVQGGGGAVDGGVDNTDSPGGAAGLLPFGKS